MERILENSVNVTGSHIRVIAWGRCRHSHFHYQSKGKGVTRKCYNGKLFLDEDQMITFESQEKTFIVIQQ